MHTVMRQEWILYHGYKRSEADKGRVVLLDKLQWSEDGAVSKEPKAVKIENGVYVGIE